MTVPLTYNVREPGPSPFMYAITPSANALSPPIRGFMTATAGTVIGTNGAGTSVTLTVLASTVYPIQFASITGGTATGIIGLV